MEFELPTFIGSQPVAFAKTTAESFERRDAEPLKLREKVGAEDQLAGLWRGAGEGEEQAFEERRELEHRASSVTEFLLPPLPQKRLIDCDAWEVGFTTNNAPGNALG